MLGAVACRQRLRQHCEGVRLARERCLFERPGASSAHTGSPSWPLDARPRDHSCRPTCTKASSSKLSMGLDILDRKDQHVFMSGKKQFDVEAARQAALGVFWKQGYADTSLEDITKTMGISRSSFYNSFGSKHALFLDVINLYSTIVGTELSAELTETTSPKAVLSRMTDKILETTGVTGEKERRGCLLGNTALELAQRHPDIAARTFAGLEGLRSIFEAVLEHAVQSGTLSHQRPPEEWAGFLTATVQGALVLAKSGAPPEMVRGVMSVAIDSLY